MDNQMEINEIIYELDCLMDLELLNEYYVKKNAIYITLNDNSKYEIKLFKLK